MAFHTGCHSDGVKATDQNAATREFGARQKIEADSDNTTHAGSVSMPPLMLDTATASAIGISHRMP